MPTEGGGHEFGGAEHGREFRQLGGELPARWPGPQGAFVGRSGELALLDEALVRGANGTPQIVAIEGIAGIGKTTLVRRFVAQVDPARVFWCSADQDEVDLPWGLLSQLADVAKAKGIPHIADALGEPEAATDPFLVGSSLLRLVGEHDLAVVVIDDAHWADRQSLAAARFAFRRLPPGELVVVMTYRPEEAGRLGEGWRRLLVEKGVRARLGGLAVPELIQLSEAVTGLRLSRRAATRLFDQTSGHPLYARSLLEQLPPATLERSEGPLPAPAELAGTVLARLSSCSAPAREVVRLASVLGVTCKVTDLRALLEPADFADALGEAVEAGLLREVPGTGGMEVSFPHILERSAVYQDLPPRQRRKLHALAALALVGRAALRHRAAAFVGPDSELAGEAEEFARQDIAAGRFQRGAIELMMALGLTPPGPARRARLLAAVEALLESGDVAGASALADDLAALPDDPWSDYVEGYLAFLSARVGDAEALLTRAWGTLDNGGTTDGPPDLAVRIASLLTILGVLKLDYAAMLRFGEKAVRGEPSSDWVAGFAWLARLIGLALAGRARDAQAHLDRLEKSGGLNNPDGIMARGIVRLWTDDLTGARADLSHLIEKEDVGEPLRVSQAVGFLGEAAFRMGLLDDAVEQTELAVSLASEAGRAWELPMLHGLAALPQAARGQFAEADNHVGLAVHWAGIMGVKSSLAYANAARAFVALAQEDPEGLHQAASDFTEVCDSREPGSHSLGPVLAEALVALGRFDEAARALKKFAAMVRGSGRRSAMAATSRVGGQLAAAQGDWDRAELLFSEAAATADELAMPLGSGLAHLAWGRAAVQAGKRKIAARELQMARKVFEACGAKAFALIADHALEKMGVSRAAGSPRRRGLLTPTEDAVVRLATTGSSNAEIARQLAVSVKTVEYHLTHIYAKFGISSRRELALRALALEEDL
ncbi:MAG TPA: AAA family ATPase [Acidimicrobiales bacterium]|nr:AAA family ATPase [Acidimicrobiales bacterium]